MSGGGQNTMGAGGGESSAGRRPLIVSPEKRNMLLGICDSLNHIRQPAAAENNNMQLRPDLAQSTPNLLDRTSAPSVNGTSSKPANTSRFVYNRKAMQEITQSLEAVKNPQKYHISNGYENHTDSTPDHNEIIQQLIKIGYGEVRKKCFIIITLSVCFFYICCICISVFCICILSYKLLLYINILIVC